MTSTTNSIDYFKNNYNSISKHYKAFTNDIVTLITKILKSQSINYDTIQSRVKSFESSVNKLKTKQYENGYHDMIDLSGIRIIAQTQLEVNQICEAIEKEFIVDEKNSENKIDKYKDNEFGYTSRHLVLELTQERISLLEYSDYENMKVEVQIRTILQHSWASLSHDKAYKFNQVLPREINRELNELAAMLEHIDNSFVRISTQIDQYALTINDGIGDNKNIELTTLSLITFLNEQTNKYRFKSRDFNNHDKDIIEELNRFDIFDTKQLGDLLNHRMVKKLSESAEHTNYLGYLRDAMAIADIKKYISKAYNHEYVFEEEDLLVLKQLYGVDTEQIPEEYIM
jgi:ppGpp synthetase/RelA/SpoT-type nucleotidyltranferase